MIYHLQILTYAISDIHQSDNISVHTATTILHEYTPMCDFVRAEIHGHDDMDVLKCARLGHLPVNTIRNALLTHESVSH